MVSCDDVGVTCVKQEAWRCAVESARPRRAVGVVLWYQLAHPEDESGGAVLHHY